MPRRFFVLWPETLNLSAGRQRAHFRRQPPGPPGPLARQPRMTSVPVLARGFAAQECRRGLREAAAQGADVRPHFFFSSPKSQLAHRPSGLTATSRANSLPALCPHRGLHVRALGLGDLAAPGGSEQLGNCLPGDRRHLGTSSASQLSVCLPLPACFSVRFSVPSPCLNFHLFVPKLVCLSVSLSPFQPPLPPSLESNTQPGETAWRSPKEGTGPACTGVQEGLPWQPRGTASAPSRAGGGGAGHREQWE